MCFLELRVFISDNRLIVLTRVFELRGKQLTTKCASFPWARIELQT